MSPPPNAAAARTAVRSGPRPAPRAAPAAAPDRRERLRVAPAAGRARRTRITVVTLALVGVASLFVVVAFHTFSVQSAFSVDRLDKERRNEQLRYERLREEVARKSSPDAVISAARDLGMVPADREVFIEAPPAAPRADEPTAPESLSTDTYREAKRALDQNP